MRNTRDDAKKRNVRNGLSGAEVIVDGEVGVKKTSRSTETKQTGKEKNVNENIKEQG